MSFRVVGKVLRDSDEKGARRLILIVLAEAAHDDGVVWLSQADIAVKSRLSRPHVAKTIVEMDEEGVLETRKAQRGRKRISVFRLVLEGLDEVDYDRLPFELDSPFTVSGIRTPSDEHGVRSVEATVSDPSGAYKEEPSKGTVLERVAAAWSHHAPPLIEHPARYYKTSTVRTAVKSANRTYSAESIVAAIANYAFVLQSEDHLWDYRWPLDHFLLRGLDRFVPEADPRRNYRRRKDGTGPPDSAFDAVDDV